jgi:hypothetical protein
MKKKDKLNWEYKGENFTVGECVLENIADNALKNSLGKLIVFFKGNLYTYYLTGSESCCIEDIYQKRKPYWVNPQRVFQILKVA